MSIFPAHIPVTASVLEQWRDDEYASWEDHNGAQDHVYELLGRRRSGIDVNNMDELRTFLRSADYHGDPSAWDDRHPFHRALARTRDRLRDLLKQADAEAAEGVYKAEAEAWSALSKGKQ